MDLIYEIDTQIYQLFYVKLFFFKKITSLNKGIRKSTHINLKDTVGNLFRNGVENDGDNEFQIIRRTKMIVEKHFAFSKRFDTINSFLKGTF